MGAIMPGCSHGRRVVHILDSSVPGGGPRALLATARGLAARGWSSVAICGDDGPLAADLRDIGVPAEALPIAGKLRFLRAFPGLVRRVNRLHPTAAIVYGPVAGSIGGVAARLAGVRDIVYYAGYPSYYADWDAPRRLRNAIVERTACGCASAVWCVSTGDRDLYLRRRAARGGKFHVVPGAVASDLRDRLRALGAEDVPGHRLVGVNAGAPRPSEVMALREKLSLSPSAVVIGYVGRLIWWKGVDVLLRSLAHIIAASPCARLVIVGDGPERGALERLAVELELADYVTFLGLQRDVVPYYLLADVVVAPSLQEPGGMVALEAMASGRAVVASRVNGFSDSICPDVTGRLVTPGDAVALAEGILWALDSPDRLRALGERGRERALRHFTEEQMAARVDRLLRLGEGGAMPVDELEWAACAD